MHKSPPCISTGVLKNVVYRKSYSNYFWSFFFADDFIIMTMCHKSQDKGEKKAQRITTQNHGLQCLTGSILYFEVVLTDDLMYMIFKWLPVLAHSMEARQSWKGCGALSIDKQKVGRVGIKGWVLRVVISQSLSRLSGWQDGPLSGIKNGSTLKMWNRFSKKLHPSRHNWWLTGDKLVTSDPVITSFYNVKLHAQLVTNWWLVHNWWQSPIRPAGTEEPFWLHFFFQCITTLAWSDGAPSWLSDKRWKFKR